MRLKSGELSEEEKREWILLVSRALIGGKTEEIEGKYKGTMKVHVLRHDRTLAARAVDSKAGYWLKAREPTSSASVGKCKACEYNPACPKTLYKE